MVKQRKTIKRKPESYVVRDYRLAVPEHGLVSSRVCIGETDLHILADKDVAAIARELVVRCRLQLESYIGKYPDFISSLKPLALDGLAPPLVRKMLRAAQDADVGPMAAVAGTIAGEVGHGLLASGLREVIVENGGDIFIQRNQMSTVAIFAGESPLSYNVGIRLQHEQMPCGVCTSSGTVGHSLSFGEADSVTVIAESVALADAAATRLGNEVGRGRRGKDGVNNALAVARDIAGIRGVVVICDEMMGAMGSVELVRL